MITKEQLKRELEKLQDNLLEEVYTLLQRVVNRKDVTRNVVTWENWRSNLNQFTPDFMSNRDQSTGQYRESLD